jgi:L-iditol 2-dehydrogenase
MKAAQITGYRKIEIKDVPDLGELENGKVRFKTECISICGSDIHGAFDKVLPEEDYPLPPGMPIHEVASIAVESKDDRYPVGTRAIIIPNYRNPDGSIGTGGAVEYIDQTHDKIIKLPDWGDLEDWIMLQHSGTVLYSAKHWGNIFGKKIAILGQGGIGLSFTMFASKQGAAEVVGIDKHDYRLDKSISLGATKTIKYISLEDLIEKTEDITDTELFDVVVDASGNEAGFNTCLNIIKPQGKFITFSIVTADMVEFEHSLMLRKNIDIHATQIATTSEPIAEIRELVSLAERGWWDPKTLKSHVSDLSDLQKSYEEYADQKNNVIKNVVKFNL